MSTTDTKAMDLLDIGAKEDQWCREREEGANQITDSDIVQKFVRVEYPHLSEAEQKLCCERELAKEHDQSIAYAIRNFADRRDEYFEGYDFVDYPDLQQQSLGFLIYGNGGLHRYYVRANGTICFSAHHSSPEAQARAQQEGFELFE